MKKFLAAACAFLLASTLAPAQGSNAITPTVMQAKYIAHGACPPAAGLCTSSTPGLFYVCTDPNSAGQHYDCNNAVWVLGSGGVSTFTQLGAGTSTGKSLLVGNGSSLAPTGTGTITATSVRFDPNNTLTASGSRVTLLAGSNDDPNGGVGFVVEDSSAANQYYGAGYAHTGPWKLLSVRTSPHETVNPGVEVFGVQHDVPVPFQVVWRDPSVNNKYGSATTDRLDLGATTEGGVGGAALVSTTGSAQVVAPAGKGIKLISGNAGGANGIEAQVDGSMGASANDTFFAVTKAAADSATSNDVFQVNHTNTTVGGTRNLLSAKVGATKGWGINFLSSSWGMFLRDTSAAFNVTTKFTSSSALTAARTLTVDMGNADQTLAFPIPSLAGMTMTGLFTTRNSAPAIAVPTYPDNTTLAPSIDFQTQGLGPVPWSLYAHNGAAGNHDHVLHLSTNMRYTVNGGIARVDPNVPAWSIDLESRYTEGDPNALHGGAEINWNLDPNTPSGSFAAGIRPWFMLFDMDHRMTSMSYGAGGDSSNPSDMRVEWNRRGDFQFGFFGGYGTGSGGNQLVVFADGSKSRPYSYDRQKDPGRFLIDPAGEAWYGGDIAPIVGNFRDFASSISNLELETGADPNNVNSGRVDISRVREANVRFGNDFDSGSSRVAIHGARDQIQLRVRTYSTQTNNPVRIDDPNNVALFTVSGAGAGTFASTVTAAGFVGNASSATTAAGLSATLALGSGGTNQTSWTASRCVQVNSAGTALESAAAACGSGGSGHTIQDEGSSLPAETNLNCVGAGITCADDPNSGATTITVTGAVAADCVEVAAWTPCSGTTACTFLSDSCVTWTDMSSTPAYYGTPFSLDMDHFSHLRLLLMGREGAGQTGTVTINLRDRTNGVTENTAVSTTIPSGETCVSRASTVADLTSLTGIHSFVLQISDSTNLDDPGLSAIVVQACSGAF